MLRIVKYGSTDYEKVVDLRDRVLRKPLGLAFTTAQLEAEATELIISDFHGDHPIATLQFKIDGSRWTMRQVAVDPALHRTGIGRRLVRFSEDWARREGARSIDLHARATVQKFYSKMGYQPVGEQFEEVGIPHLSMVKDLTKRNGYVEYVHAYPTDIAQALKDRPLAVVPWGALEWHGDHLPTGLDGIVAQEFAKRLASRTSGVLLPTFYLPITTLPHRTSQEVKTETLRAVLRDLFSGLARSGVRAALVVSGHYAQGHEIELYQAAEDAQESGISVMAASPLEVLEEEDYLDHAGRWEASCLEMFEPGSLRTAVLRGVHIKATEHGVLGESPLSSNPIEGWEVMDRAWDVWAKYADHLLRGDLQPLTSFYERRRRAYQPYCDRYFQDSWEQAIQLWWSQKAQELPER